MKNMYMFPIKDEDDVHSIAANLWKHKLVHTQHLKNLYFSTDPLLKLFQNVILLYRSASASRLRFASNCLQSKYFFALNLFCQHYIKFNIHVWI